jgi:DNA adenine methylase
MSKDNKLDYCRNITSKLDNLPYDVSRAIMYMLMKYCVYMGNLFVNNKFYFTGLDLHISIQNRCFFLEKKTFDNLKEVSNFLNSTKGKNFNKDYKEVLSKAKERDFVFLDPPYVEEHNYGFNYNKD